MPPLFCDNSIHHETELSLRLHVEKNTHVNFSDAREQKGRQIATTNLVLGRTKHSG